MKKYLLSLMALVSVALSASAAAEPKLWSAGGSEVAAGTVLFEDDVLKASTVYVSKATSYGYKFDDTHNFKNSMQIRVDKDPNEANPYGTEKAESTPIVIVAKKDASITAYYRRQANSGSYVAGDGKDVKLFGEDFKVVASTSFADVEEAKDYSHCTQTWDLEAGKTYVLAARGTTLQLNGLEYVCTADEGPIDGTKTSFKEPLALEIDKTYTIDMNEGNEAGLQFYTFQSAYDCQVYITPSAFAHFIVTKGNFPFDENYNDQEDAVDEKTFKMVGGFGPLDEFDDPFDGPESQNPTYNWTAKAGVKYYVMADFVMEPGTFTVTAGDPVIPAQGTIVENPINLNSRPSVTWDSEKNVADGSTYYTYTAPRDGVLTITMNGWVSEEVNVGEDGFYDPWDRDLAGGPQYSGEIKNEYAEDWSSVKYTFAVEEGVTYCIVIPDLYSAYGDITVSAKFTIPGVYGQLIEEMDAVAERVAELDKMYDADKRAQLRLTEMWARIMDQIYYEQRMLEHDMINVEKPTNLQLALHKTRIATIYVALNSFETAAQLHANKEQIMKGIYEALLNLISSRDIMAKQYAIPADDAQWNSICARIAAQERTVDALYDAVEDPTAEQISACEVEMSSIEAAMEAFAAKMESEATAIQSATTTANDANIYNVAGQKSSANYRGIIIKNGKKMMVK